MKLAMAVGDNRHYRVCDVAPRHFVQSGVGSGLNAESIHGLFRELVRDAPAALAAVLHDLPNDFPRTISEPITRGFETRLGQIRRFLDALTGQNQADNADQG
jgi:serine/threonine-protein kinase HipA